MNTEQKIAKILELIKELNKDQDSLTLSLEITNRHEKSYLTFEQVMQVVCDNTGKTPEEINKLSRLEEVVILRQICHYIAFRKCKTNLGAIGKYFGNKDHSTVLYGIRKIEGLLTFDQDFKEKYGFFVSKY